MCWVMASHNSNLKGEAVRGGHPSSCVWFYYDPSGVHTHNSILPKVKRYTWDSMDSSVPCYCVPKGGLLLRVVFAAYWLEMVAHP